MNLLKEKYKLYFYDNNGYLIVAVSSSLYRGRPRVHIGKGTIDHFPVLKHNLEKEIELFFESTDEITYEAVDAFLKTTVHDLKKGRSLFDFENDFIQKNIIRINPKTKKPLSEGRIRALKKSIEYLKSYLKTNNIKSQPNVVNDAFMINFMNWLTKGSNKYNYNVKLYNGVKRYFKYLDEKGVKLNKSYLAVVYNEEYDNNDYEYDDIALSVNELKELIKLRNDLILGKKRLPNYKTCGKLRKIQAQQYSKKMQNIKLSLDCFLFMCSTGQYHSDIIESKLSFRRHKEGKRSIAYKRAKNNYKAIDIPIINTEYFISQGIIKKYGIKSGENFPYTLTINTLNNHLTEISKLADFDFNVRSRMARKTFASVLYFDRNNRISIIQKLLGHSSEKNTRRYLRISDDSVVDEVMRSMV